MPQVVIDSSLEVAVVLHSWSDMLQLVKNESVFIGADQWQTSVEVNDKLKHVGHLT